MTCHFSLNHEMDILSLIYALPNIDNIGYICAWGGPKLPINPIHLLGIMEYPPIFYLPQIFVLRYPLSLQELLYYVVLFQYIKKI